MKLNREQAACFMLRKQGLLGEYRFSGKTGIVDYVRQAGCIQFDPVDVCGKNAELVLQARVAGFQKQQLSELLYEDRQLLDYFDKNLAIIHRDDWPYFEPIRELHRSELRSAAEVEAAIPHIRAAIRERGPLCSQDLELNHKVDWYWSSTSLSRAALETMYFRGDLIVHHKRNTVKYYALSEDYLPAKLLQAGDPHASLLEHHKWRMLRRIAALGLLWNKASDAWLFIQGLKSAERNRAFAELVCEGKVLELAVDGLPDKLYCLAEDTDLLDEIASGSSGSSQGQDRMELLAPLDGFLWDRKLIRAFFGFEYTWEIYTPAAKRQYGHYTLPILWGERFIGRLEAVRDRKNRLLMINAVWLEPGVKSSGRFLTALKRCVKRFAVFNGMADYRLPESFIYK